MQKQDGIRASEHGVAFVRWIIGVRGEDGLELLSLGRFDGFEGLVHVWCVGKRRKSYRDGMDGRMGECSNR